MFTEQQKQLLEGKLDPDVVKTRAGPNGRKLSYLEGWHIIQGLNEVFGWGCWSAETVELVRQHDPVVIPPSEEHPRGGVVVTYSARVRLTVYSEDHSRKVVRERTGGHRGFGPTVGQAIEDCLKSAETDALKRCASTFGNRFGLCLYDREQKGVGKESPRPLPAANERALAAIDEGFDNQQRPSISERALSTVRKPAPPGANGRMPY
jgi:DNA recombination protein Rad52